MVKVILVSGETVNIKDMLTCNGHILSLKTDDGKIIILSDILEIL